MKPKTPPKVGREKELIKELRAMVEKDYGKPCKTFNYFCGSCVVYMAVQILEDSYNV